MKIISNTKLNFMFGGKNSERERINGNVWDTGVVHECHPGAWEMSISLCFHSKTSLIYVCAVRFVKKSLSSNLTL